MPEVGNPEVGNKGDRYSAFISYRHMPRDRRWAIRIMAELEAYRTPKALRREAFPDRIGHLFRDEDEIPASTDLTDQIKDALARSDFLIVVCSPDTPASRWVRREIELFQELGKGDRIIPLLIAGEPDQSFPPELRRRVATPSADSADEAGWKEIEPVAGDVRPRKDESKAKTERRALLRLAAALLGCRFDDLARRDEERRKAALRQKLGALAAVLAVAAVAGAWWWDANLRVKTQYCAGYGERWAVPFCIGGLNAAQQSARTTSFRFHIQGGRVLDIARVNGAGALTDDQFLEFNDEPWTKGVALWRFAYAGGANPDLASVIMEDRTGLRLRAVNYRYSEDHRQAIAEFDHSFDVAERQLAWASGFGLSAGGLQQLLQQHSEIGQHRLSFDAAGRLLRRDFEPVRGEGRTIADAVGSYGRAYQYDAAGLPARIWNLDSRGNPLVEKSGIAGQRRSYDALGNLVAVEWLDSDGSLRANQQNFARAALTYSNIGNVVEIAYFAAGGGLIERSDLGVARRTSTYDAHGNRVEQAFFGADGKPILSKTKVARITARYDERGYEVEDRYFGTSGKPVFDGSGVARVTYRYDERGRQIESAYFDVDGRPVLGGTGCAHGTIRYDTHGNPAELSCFGTDGKPILGKEGIARATAGYDDDGDMTAAAYFGADGRPILNKEGYASITRSYVRANVTAESYFGLDGKPVLARPGECARMTVGYDEHGNIKEYGCFGTDGKPVLAKPADCARGTFQYDERGNMTELACFGADGKLVLSVEGVARMTRRYDERGNLVEEADFGIDGKPILNKNGAARGVVVYDERGNKVEESNFGIDGKLVLNKMAWRARLSVTTSAAIWRKKRVSAPTASRFSTRTESRVRPTATTSAATGWKKPFSALTVSLFSAMALRVLRPFTTSAATMWRKCISAPTTSRRCAPISSLRGRSTATTNAAIRSNGPTSELTVSPS
jgi:hypothetical protein